MTPQTRAKPIFIFRLYSSVVVVVAAQWAGSFYVIFLVIRTWSQTAGKRLCTHLTWSHNTLTQAGEGEVEGERGGSQKNTAGSLDNRGRRVHNSEMLEEIFHKFSFSFSFHELWTAAGWRRSSPRFFTSWCVFQLWRFHRNVFHKF